MSAKEDGRWVKATPTLLRALGILAKRSDGVIAAEFAQIMWPDSGGWRRSCHRGKRGTQQGACMWLKAGQWLHQLRRKGIVQERHRLLGEQSHWQLTAKGTAVLREGGWRVL